MSFKISNNLLYQLLFALCIGVPYLNIYELTFLVWMTTLFITLKQKYSLTVFQYVFPYIVVMIVGSFTLFFYESTMYEIIRDITYLVKPIIGMLIGYQLCRNKDMRPFHTIVNVGLFIAIIHLIIIFCNAIIHKVININELREYSGYFSDFEVYALIIVLFHKQFEIFLGPKRFWFLFIVIGISSFLYLSRANFIQFCLFYMVLKGYFTLNKKTVIILSTIVSLKYENMDIKNSIFDDLTGTDAQAEVIGLNITSEESVLASITESSPTVITDKDDYAPGATAQIRASGFKAGSTISFSIADSTAFFRKLVNGLRLIV